jgi:4-hydroxy-3-methylbut-2-en-1-yl diphosphate reductase
MRGSPKSEGLLIAAPLRLEALLIGSATHTAQVRRTGMGSERSFAAARKLLREQPETAVLAMGFCGGLDASSEPGDVIVADWLLRNEVTSRDEIPAKPTACAGGEALAATLASHRLRVRRGMVVSVVQPVRGRRRTELRKRGAIAVDMESAWLAFGLAGWPFGVVRVVVDTPVHELRLSPATLTDGVRAAVVLRRAAGAVDELVRECGVHTIFGTDSQLA